MKNLAKMFGLNLSQDEALVEDKETKTAGENNNFGYSSGSHTENQIDKNIDVSTALASTNIQTQPPEENNNSFGEFENYLNNLKKEAGLVAAPQKIAISDIEPNPYQPRKTFKEESIAELAASIKEFGVIQPLIVRQKELGNKYELVAGERRLRASKEAGLLEVPVIARSLTDKEMAELAMIENLQREDLHFLEEAEGFAKLISNFGFTQEELASRMGKSQSTVANKLRLLKLPQSIHKAIIAQSLTERHARALLRLDDEKVQLEILEVINLQKLNVRQTEEFIDKYLENISREKNPTPVSKQKVTKIVKDVRIYINTINSVTSQMKKNGMDVSYKQDFDGEYVTITMQIRNNKSSKS